MSQNNSCDYFPRSKRQKFFKEIEQFCFYNALYCFKEMKYIDRKLKEYYEDAYHGLLSTNITFEIPILSKFIIQNTPKGMNSVEL